jgi:hypothetical protein
VALVFWLTLSNLIPATVASSDPAVTFDIGAQVLDPRAISPDLIFVGSDHVPRGMITPVEVQPVTVAVELKFFLAKPLFVGPKVGYGSGLSGGKSVHSERECQNQVKVSAHHSLDSEGLLIFLAILTLMGEKSRAVSCKLAGKSR